VSQEGVIRAAGGIVLQGEPEHVAVVHRPKYDDWSFPKGKLIDGEDEEAAALREVLEETGLRCRLGGPVDAVTYADRFGRPKVVRYWTMTPESGAFEPGDEVDELRWLLPEEAERLLTYSYDRELLRTLMERKARATVYVVRHAKAGVRGTWRGPDEERPLTRRGRRQAHRLVDRFAGLDVGRVISSPLVRCVQTLEPLVRARGIELELAPELAEDEHVSEAVALVRGLPAVPTVLCSHGSEIEAMIGAFEADGAVVEGARGIAKGSVWVLDRRDDHILSARYLPAPPG
jgi:8-oxo-dGTP diphosphatase